MTSSAHESNIRLLLKAIQNLKHGDFQAAEADSIPISQALDIRLVPVGQWILHQEDLIQTFAQWREAAKENFLTQFDMNVQGTRNYLSKFAIEGRDRILFLVDSRSVGPIGHLGLTKISPASAEIDNVLRKPERLIPGLMTYCELALVQWTFRHLGISEISLQVLESNKRGVSLHRRVGFEVCERIPLRIVKDGNLTQLVRQNDSDETTVDYLLIMKTSRKDNSTI
jgi:RimJ/RimL family protein N-acetyltransferase